MTIDTLFVAVVVVFVGAFATGVVVVASNAVFVVNKTGNMTSTNAHSLLLKSDVNT